MPESLNDFAESEDLRAVIRRLQRQVEKYKARHEELVTVTIQAAKDAVIALGPLPPVKVPAHDRSRKSEEVAVWVLGDWQGAKKTTTYNSQVMVNRVERFWQSAEDITSRQRSDHPVRGCVVIFGGDMVEGLFNFPTQAFEVDSTIFGQYVTVSQLLVRTVRQALSVYEWVKVVAEWGNHGRIGSKRDTVPRADNVDRMCYELARQLLASEPRLTWEDCPDDIQHLEIGEYRALVCHGDEVGRNGFASRNTIINHVNRWKSGAHRWPFRDAYFHHYHVHAEEPLADGRGAIYWTGSTESDNRYANDMLAASAEPTQRLHFVSPSRGRVTSQYKIWLDE